MFSQWAVEILRKLSHCVKPLFKVVHPVTHLANFFFAISVFFYLNRRPSRYNNDFWGGLLYLVQLFKVAYMLRFLMVELVYRELRTFFCFAYPKLAKYDFTKKWQYEDSCVVKVVNLICCLLFIGLNLSVAYGVELLGLYIKDCIKKMYIYLGVCAENRQMQKACCTKKPRKRQKIAREANKPKQTRSLSRTRSLFRFWPLGAKMKNVHPTNNVQAGRSSVRLRNMEIEKASRKTRSGKKF